MRDLERNHPEANTYCIQDQENQFSHKKNDVNDEEQVHGIKLLRGYTYICSIFTSNNFRPEVLGYQITSPDLEQHIETAHSIEQHILARTLKSSVKK